MAEEGKLKGLMNMLGTVAGGLGIGALRALDVAPEAHVRKAFVATIRKTVAASGLPVARQRRLVKLLREAVGEILLSSEENKPS
jgi:hypothetical protein